MTITDEQIRGLRAKAILEIARLREIVDATTDALIFTTRHPNDPDYPEEITRGRARCAEILQQQQLALNVRVEPPAHPTSLGDVWIGTTQPSAEALVAVLPVTKKGDP